MISFTIKSRVLLLLNYFSTLLVGISEAGITDQSNPPTVKRAVPAYNGEWDISARQTAIMCEAIKHKNYNGSVPLPEPKRESYLRDGVCWKNAWIPCDDAETADDRLAKKGPMALKRKPCGHFKMVSTAKHECD